MDPVPPPEEPRTGAAAAEAFRDHVDALLKRLEAHRAAAPRYEEVREIARGGMGVVIEVRDQDLRRALALKRIHPKRVDSADGSTARQFLARFLQEAQITGQLGHPGIPPVHELGLDRDGRAYFTMPFIRGRTLEEVIELARGGRDGWNVRRALGVLVKVCEAVAFAHARRVVHRDLKPSNVLVGRFGETYVMDWGLARVLDRPDLFDLRIKNEEPKASSIATDRRDARANDVETPLRTMDDLVIGTPAYMPPEQALSQVERIGPAADVYAAGAMLYHLLAGRPPYQPPEGPLDPRTVLALVRHGPPPRIAQLAPEVDPDLAAICDKAMSRSIEDRYASMSELAADLEAWVDHRPVKANPPAVRRALRLFVERHRAASVTAAIATIALLGFAVWTFVTLSRSNAEKGRALADSRRQADALSVPTLVARETELWPAVPEKAAEMRAWIRAIDDLAQRAETYRGERDRTSDETARREIDAIVAGSEKLRSVRSAVIARAELAESLVKRTIVDVARDWDAAIARIAASPKYGGLALKPQIGLVPLGPDAQSGLEEFWVVASGPRPDRSVPSPDDVQAGIVLVLIPGGTFTMGTSLTDHPFVDREPRHEVTLRPYFCSRFEVTQAQWLRVMGNDPARARPDVYSNEKSTLRNPVESVNWIESAAFCSHLELALPTQEQWERAARAGQWLEYGYGPDLASLAGHENVKTTEFSLSADAADFQDGHRSTAPVGSYAPNAFGLCDVLGNVSEWCRDAFDPRGPVVVGQPESGTRAYRGGSYAHSGTSVRPSSFQWNNPSGSNLTLGLRPVRELPDPS